MPDLQGICEHFSPKEIVTGMALDFNNHCKAQLGLYVEAHEDKVVTNTQHPRTFHGVYLCPTGNIKGTLKVFDLKTAVLKKQQTITEPPTPDQVITILDKCAKMFIREDIQSRLSLLKRHRHKFDWENDDPDKSNSLVEDTHP